PRRYPSSCPTRRSSDLQVLPDVMAGFQGPLAGLLTGMGWAARAGATHMLSVACDTPFLPHDLAQRLRHDLNHSGAEIAVARDREDRKSTRLNSSHDQTS